MPVDQLGDNLLIGHGVNFTAALRAVVAAGIGRSDADLQRSEQGRRAGSSPRLAVIGKVPGESFPSPSTAAFDFVELRRSFRLPTMLVVARPLDAHRSSDRAGK